MKVFNWKCGDHLAKNEFILYNGKSGFVLSPFYSLKRRGKRIIYLHALACECCFFRFSSCVHACWNFKIIIQLLRDVLKMHFFLIKIRLQFRVLLGEKIAHFPDVRVYFGNVVQSQDYRISVKIARIMYFGVGYNVDIANMLMICFECSKR